MRLFLTAALVLPALGAIAVLLTPSSQARRPRSIALLTSVASFACFLPLIWAFDASSAALQFGSDVLWISSPAVRYYVGVDGISIFVVVLIPFLGCLSVLAASSPERAGFFFWLLLLEAAGIGIFVAADLLLFFLFWEFMPLPLFFLTGQAKARSAALFARRCFVYSAAGSALMLLAILWLQRRFGTFDYGTISALLANGPAVMSLKEQLWLCLAFFAAFAARTAILLLNTWSKSLRGAASGEPLILIGVLLTTGVYGLARFCLPFFPDAVHHLASAVSGLAIAGIAALCVLTALQKNLARLLLCICAIHGLVMVLAIFSFEPLALQGAIFHLTSLGLSIGAILVALAILPERLRSEVTSLGSLRPAGPTTTAFLALAALAVVGMPPFSNFVGLWLMVRGLFQGEVSVVILAVVALVLAGVCVLRIFYHAWKERIAADSYVLVIGSREKRMAAVASAALILLSVSSPLLLGRIDVSASALLDRVSRREIFVEVPPQRVLPAETASR